MADGKAFHGQPGIGPADDCTDGTDNEAHEELALVLVATTEVGTIVETLDQDFQGRRRFSRGGKVRGRFHDNTRWKAGYRRSEIHSIPENHYGRTPLPKLPNFTSYMRSP